MYNGVLELICASNLRVIGRYRKSQTTARVIIRKRPVKEQITLINGHAVNRSRITVGLQYACISVTTILVNSRLKRRMVLYYYDEG